MGLLQERCEGILENIRCLYHRSWTLRAEPWFPSAIRTSKLPCNTSEVKKKTGTKSKQKQGVDDLLLGHIDLAALTYFQESYRLDLNHRAMELKTQRRTWVLQVDGVADFYNWCVLRNHCRHSSPVSGAHGPPSNPNPTQPPPPRTIRPGSTRSGARS